MATTYQVDQVVDAKGQVCPMPVLMLAKAYRVLPSGKILCLSATDPGSVPDISAWAAKTGATLLESVVADGVYTFYLKKA
jgi:tRNA 2-thiouridine synthesizing protein A